MVAALSTVSGQDPGFEGNSGVYDLGFGVVGISPASYYTLDQYHGKRSVMLSSVGFRESRALKYPNPKVSIDQIRNPGVWYKHLSGSKTPFIVYVLSDGRVLRQSSIISYAADWTYNSVDLWSIDGGEEMSLADIQTNYDGIVYSVAITAYSGGPQAETIIVDSFSWR